MRPFVECPLGQPVPDIWRRIFALSPDLPKHYNGPDDEGYRRWINTYGRKEWEGRSALLGQETVIGMVVNPDLRCGIREHTGYFSKWLEAKVVVLSQDPKTHDHRALIDEALANQVTILHVQHEFSLFRDRMAFGTMLDYARNSGLKLILDLHTGGMTEERKAELKTWAMHAHRVIVHNSQLMEDLADFHPAEIPLALPEEVLWAPEADELLDDLAPIVGSFGFFNEHKGFSELAQSLGIVRKDFPGLKLLLLGTHNSPPQDRYYEKVAQAASKGRFKIIDRFCTVDEIVCTLGICDVVVLPYRVNVTSQSGAAEIALLSGRPCVFSTSKMLRHIPDDHVAARIPFDGDIPDMSRVILDVLRKNPMPSSVRASRRRLAERRGSTLALRYDAVYRELR